MSFNCPCSTRNPSWPNGESISWYALPGIMACKLRISAGVKMMSVVMPTTAVRAFDACEGGCYPAAPAPRVVGVEGVEYGIVRVGVVAPAEFLALILLVGRCAVYCGEFLLVLLREVVSQRTPVREQPQGVRQPVRPSRRRLAARRTSCRPRWPCAGSGRWRSSRARPGRRGDQDQFADALRLQDRPFDGLESPDRTSYERVDAADAERAGQQAVCTDDVADRERREILVIGLPFPGSRAAAPWCRSATRGCWRRPRKWRAGSRKRPASTVCGHQSATSELAVRAWHTHTTLSYAALGLP